MEMPPDHKLSTLVEHWWQLVISEGMVVNVCARMLQLEPTFQDVVIESVEESKQASRMTDRPAVKVLECVART